MWQPGALTLVASLNCLIIKKQYLWPYPTWGWCRDRHPGAILLVHNSRPALTWVIFRELLICISGSCVSLESQRGSCVANETGDLILFHWQPVEDAENSNVSGTGDLTQAFDPVNLAGMWGAVQKRCFLKTFMNITSQSTKPFLVTSLPKVMASSSKLSIQHDLWLPFEGHVQDLSFLWNWSPRWRGKHVHTSIFSAVPYTQINLRKCSLIYWLMVKCWSEQIFCYFFVLFCFLNHKILKRCLSLLGLPYKIP